MNKCSAAILFAITCMLCLAALALQPPEALALQPSAMHGILRQGIEKAFNMDPLGAGAQFQKAVELDPDDPTGYAFQAVNQLSIAETSFDPKQREASREAMLRYVSETLARGDRRVGRNPRDSRAWFAMALARTAKFRWAQRQKEYFTAADEAYNLWSCLEKVQKEDPENYDSYLLTGTIRYNLDRLPELARFFSSLLITKGDSRRGLEDVELAATKGDLLKELAQSELISVYLNFEKQPGRVLPLARELQKKFPRNYNLSIALASILAELDQFKEALAIARELERGIASGKPPYAPQLQPRHDQLMGRIYFTQGDYARAEGYFRKSLSDTADYNARVRVWSYVRLGMICDARDEREQAKEYYSMALSIDTGESVAKVEARKYLKTPYRAASQQ
ncbi:MAG TPA: tetratricopeptide repeat protein [Syntrophales bacterium]|nr:tetratricopeptide repeat protein [Syntrophales bacterium]